MEPIEIVRQGYALYAERNFPAIFELLAENVTVWQTEKLPWGGVYEGRDGAGEFFTKLAQYTAATPEPIAFVPAGSHVAVYGKLRGHATATERTFELDFIHLWQVTDGKIDRFEAFIDTPAMLTALGG
ncbi:MAG: nuclear transport factor 2 family protein [Acidobacteria bacterium]|nr:nuclear transport factor 2 family protein [Acidobacteriota bacterium]MBV9669455.1 nuclear transport factor 2 family protein [Terriglobales bacterium]